MRQTTPRPGAGAGSSRLLHAARPSKQICASLSCGTCRHIITPSIDNMCLFHQNGQVHLTAKYEAPPAEFSITQVAVTKAGKAKFAPYTLHCPSCDAKLGTTCKFGPNHELVQAYKRDDVILTHGTSGDAYSGTDSITVQGCGHFLEIRDVFCFSGPAAGGGDGSSLLPLMLQPAAMHPSASRKPTAMPVLGSLDPSNLTTSRPRPYQVEVFVRACSTNSVVVLPTGVGKTLVAALAVAQMRRLNPSKWVVFLTETCPLAEQQGHYLRTELAATGGPSGSEDGLVQVLHGDNSTPAQRVALIGMPPGILVTTAGCFIGLLGLGFDLQACSLLVLDEAHHATKKHPFREVAERLGRLRGSASASDDEGPPAHLMMGLLQRATALLPAGRPPPQQGMGLPLVLGLTASPVTGKSVLSMDAQLEDLTRALDARVIMPSLFRDSLDRHATLAHTELLPVDFNAGDYGTGVGCNNESLEDVGPDDMRRRLQGSARYLALRSVVLEQVRVGGAGAGAAASGAGLRILVFVQRRAVAAALVGLLTADAGCVAAAMNPALLVGQSGKDGMTYHREQAPVLTDFRNGAVRLLVATSVVEEGLDVPACDVVLRFDGVNSLRELIQSRGRVRQRAGRYVVLCGRHDEQELQELQEREQDMLAVVESWVASGRGGESGGAEGHRDEDAACRRAVQLAR